MAVMPDWWGGRDLRDLLPRIFFEHFRGTSFVVEHEDELVAFLVGFLCPTTPARPTCTSPASTRPGAAAVWRATCTGASSPSRASAGSTRRARRHVVGQRATRSPSTSASASRSLPGDGEVDGLPAQRRPDVPGERSCKFELRLDERRTTP